MPNRLAAETSPYLLQHADNAVDWWPWCEEAFELARSLDRPILLSIGYSACHWCHVMAHESFEDEAVAAAMNRDYVSIKVDREERPDVDHIYQTAHQVLTGRPGGWPLTMFLSPDATPFFGGTYFPKTPRYRLPGFLDLLGDIARTFADQRKEIEAQNHSLRTDLGKRASFGAATHHSSFNAQPLELLRKRLQDGFDKRYGGFGEAPKFPRASDLEFLLHRFATQADERARDMALTTLTRMAEGGLFDHLGGGFFRYSTDERWQIPHFEKMLYDNGPLLRLYSSAWQIDGDARYRQVVEDTAAWAMREMQSPSGGYYAALDADSEGHEGRFYVWDRKQVKDLIAPAALQLVERHYGLDGRPNFEDKAWHLCVAEAFERSARKSGLLQDEAAAVLTDARATLLAVREQRVRPALDTKLLTSWNALMIAGMAHAARVFDRPDWLASARRAFAFVRDSLWRDGRLLATSDGGPGRLNAYLDDHVFLIDAALELLQADFDAADLAFAEELADALIEDFEDTAGGGFFFTRHDHEALIMRPKPIHDNATAAGNGVAARVLGRLGHLTGELRYLDAAERTLQACYGALGKSPLGCASLALGLAEALEPPAVIVISGGADTLKSWHRALACQFMPDTICVAIPAGLRGLPPMLDKPVSGRTAAWICRGSQCEAPVFELAELGKIIGNRVLRG